jgi:hypothetical protein
MIAGSIISPALLFLALAGGGSFAHASDPADRPPRIAALLEQGEAAEKGIGGRLRPRLAVALYCDAGKLGSAEGFFRVGRLLREHSSSGDSLALANAYLALASRLGHARAQDLHDPLVSHALLLDDCKDFAQYLSDDAFDIDAYVADLSPLRRRIANMIRQQAVRYGVDERFALAVAMAESNFNPRAQSPKNAQGVMQLIPDTQERFGVRKPFDPESNIRGGLTYLRWLLARFEGDLVLVAAAYNAGEAVVDRFNGIPPYPETQDYVRRVLYFSGMRHPALN